MPYCGAQQSTMWQSLCGLYTMLKLMFLILVTIALFYGDKSTDAGAALNPFEYYLTPSEEEKNASFYSTINEWSGYDVKRKQMLTSNYLTLACYIIAQYFVSMYVIIGLKLDRPNLILPQIVFGLIMTLNRAVVLAAKISGGYRFNKGQQLFIIMFLEFHIHYKCRIWMCIQARNAPQNAATSIVVPPQPSAPNAIPQMYVDISRHEESPATPPPPDYHTVMQADEDAARQLLPAPPKYHSLSPINNTDDV